MATAYFSSLVIFSLVITTTKATIDGFAVRLIHRDSPQSPFYDQKMTTFDRIMSAVNRSIARLNYLSRSLTSSQSLIRDVSNKLVYDHDEYIMIFKVGSPPTTVHAIADTGSSITWLKCLPCKGCDTRSSVPPIFNPSKSTTFKRLTCGAEEDCTFSITYGDGSVEVKGFIAQDNFIFEGQTQNSAVSVGELRFGCGEFSSKSQPLQGKQLGIVGLDRGESSFVAQLGVTKFSHCMMMRPGNNEKTTSVGSRMYFGSMAVIAGGQTPLVKLENKFHYYLTLDGISVGDEKVQIPDNFFATDSDGGGGFIIDSGTAFTHLKSKAFAELVKVLKKVIKLPQLANPIGPFELCFRGSFNDLDDLEPPDITLNFRNADVVLDKQSTYNYINTQEEGELLCLAILPSFCDLSILGNFQQMNYWVGYDLEAGVVSFAPVDCSIF